MVEIEWRRLNRPKTDILVGISNCESDRPLDCSRATDRARFDSTAPLVRQSLILIFLNPGLCPRKV